MQTKNIYTPWTEAREKLVLEILASKGLELHTHSRSGRPILNFYINERGVIGKSYYNDSDMFGYSPVSFSEFLTVLEANPVSFKTEISGYESIITAETVKIGCQEYSEEEWAEISKAIAQMRHGIIIDLPGKERIVVSSTGISATGTEFTFEQFDLIEAKRKELKK